MFDFLLVLHNLLRWVVIVMAILAVGNAYWGWFGKRTWTDRDRKLGSFFAISLDIQLLVGLLVYFLGGYFSRLFSDFGNVMSNSMLRFFGVEHFLLMLVAIVIVHIGSARARKAEGDVNKFRTAAIWFTLGIILILIAIPWPFSANARPWFRLPF
jgi:hypothetical protein